MVYPIAWRMACKQMIGHRSKDKYTTSNYTDSRISGSLKSFTTLAPVSYNISLVIVRINKGWDIKRASALEESWSSINFDKSNFGALIIFALRM